MQNGAEDDWETAVNSQPASLHSVTFREAFWVWVKVAVYSFGGPAGQIAVMHKLLVEEKRWISENRFLHALNYTMLLPVPEAQQLATYLGWLLHSTKGGLIAGSLFVLPGFVSILILSVLYAGFHEVTLVQALFYGLKPAVLAIVVEAVIRIGRRALKNEVMVTVSALAFIGIFIFNVPFPIIVLAAGVIGYVGGKIWLDKFHVIKQREVSDGGDDGYAITDAVPLTKAVGSPGAACSCDRIAFVELAPVVDLTLVGSIPRFCGRGDIFQQNGRCHLWWRICCVSLHCPASCGDFWLAATWRNAGWPGYGRDDPRSPGAGGAVCRVYGRLPQSGHVFANGRRCHWFRYYRLGNVCPLFYLDFSGCAVH